MIYYFYISLVVIFILLSIFLISKDLLRRSAREDKVILKAGFKPNSNLILGSITLIIMGIIIRKGILDLLELYNFLGEVYVDNIWELLDIKFLEELEILFLESDEIVNFYKVVSFKRFYLDSMIAIATFSNGLFALYKGLRKTEVCVDGINTPDQLITWDMIEEIKWLENEKQDSTGYEELTLTIKDNSKWKITDIKQTVSIKIKNDDTQLVSDLLLANVQV